MPVARALHTNGCTTDVAAHRGEPSEKSTGIRTALKQIAVVHLRPRDALLLRCHVLDSARMNTVSWRRCDLSHKMPLLAKQQAR